jgi:hypothetical protein
VSLLLLLLLLILRRSWFRLNACHAENKLDASCHLPRIASAPSGAASTCSVAVSSHPASGDDKVGFVAAAIFRVFFFFGLMEGRRGDEDGCDVASDDKLEDDILCK